MNDTISTSLSSDGQQSYRFLTTSKFLIPLSLLALLPNLLSITFHLRSRNIATSSILFWILTLNTLNILNAAIWHNDDLASWWHGKILCDIEVRLIVAGGFGGWTGATLALARSLALVLNTERVRGGREWVKEALICWAPPCWFAVVVYAVQTLRYSIAAGYGCTPQVGGTWVTVVLLLIWPVVFMLITCWYTGLIIYRLRLYRTQIASLLAVSKTSRSRFTRLFILAILLTLTQLIASLAQLTIFLTAGDMESYSWEKTHAEWNYARLISSERTWGERAGSSWCWIVFGWVAFLTVGMGDEAMKRYREIFQGIGLNKLFCCCDSRRSPADAERRTSWLESLGSKAKLLFGSKHEDSSGSFNTLATPLSSRFSKLSSNATTLLPITEPKSPTPPPRPQHEFHNPPSTLPKSKSKLTLFASMPSFSHAFAGVPPLVDTRARKEVASKILITLPSPTVGGLDDELILKMVGAEPVGKKRKDGGEVIELDALKKGMA